MAKIEPTGQDVTIGSGATQYWLANQSVGEEIESVDFGSEDWELHIQCAADDLTESATLNFSLGYVDSSGNNFIRFDGDPTAELTCPSGVTLDPSEFDETLTVESAVVPSTDYLAIQVTHKDGADAVISIGQTEGGQDYTVLSYPENNPGYPVWEATSVLLLSLGILGIAGWTKFGRAR